MDHYILNENKLILFWTIKCGVTSIIEMIMHMETGVDHSNLGKGKDELTHQTFYKFQQNMISRNTTKLCDYSDYAKVLFIRNPFHRIVSCFLDKYVDNNSPTPDDKPNVNNFFQFIKLLDTTKLKKHNMNGVINYYHFGETTENSGWDFYCKINKPKFDYIFETPSTALPEGKIVQKYDNIKKVYELINNNPTYESIKHLYERTPYSYDTWKITKKDMSQKNNFMYESLESLRKYHSKDGCRTIPYMNFYTDYMQSIIRRLYKKEFDFYKKNGFIY